LEQETRDQLKVTLIQELCQVTYPSIVQRKLSLSLVGLVLHNRCAAIGNQSIVIDVFDKLSSAGALSALLEFLRMLPEEFSRADLIALEKCVCIGLSGHIY
jgi:hypothetical protein